MTEKQIENEITPVLRKLGISSDFSKKNYLVEAIKIYMNDFYFSGHLYQTIADKFGDNAYNVKKSITHDIESCDKNSKLFQEFFANSTFYRRKGKVEKAEFFRTVVRKINSLLDFWDGMDYFD